MEDDVGALDEGIDNRRVVDAAAYDATAGLGEGRRRRPREAGDVLASQPVEQMAAHEPGGAGQGYAHGRSYSR
jgi:hypothetical protein